MRREVLDELLEARRAREPVVLATRVADGEQSLLRPLADGEDAGDDFWPVEVARQALLDDRSVLHEADGVSIFLRVYNSPVRLIVVGAVHIAQPLARLAATAGLSVAVVDPRTAFATPERFPGVDLVHTWPREAIPALSPDHRTALVTLTHDPKLDDPALEAALASDVFYIGALGSRKTHAARLDRLRAEGVGDAELRRIRGPVGMDIRARTPAEIAVAILGELIQHLRAPGEAADRAER